MDAFLKFFIASVLVHGAIFYFVQGNEWFTPPAPAPRIADGFDSSRVRAVLDRMKGSDSAPLPAPPAPRAEAAPPEPDRTTAVEAELTDRPAAPRRREERATGSLAPSNLNEILDRPLRGPQLDTPTRSAPRREAPSETSDLEKAWDSRITASESGGGGAGGSGGTESGVGRGMGGSAAAPARGMIASSGFVMGGKGEIPRAGVESALQKRLTQMQNCYQGALLEYPGLQGKLILRWTISMKGEVEEVIVEKSQLENAELHSCVVSEIAKLKFPKPEGASVFIRYPLTFTLKTY